MGAIITLTTDFGLADAYVAAMKGGSASTFLDTEVGSKVKIRIGNQ